ncbi:MAG: hypothetical protein VB135_05415 [Burkholderia sp.]
MYIGLASSSRSIYATTPRCRVQGSIQSRMASRKTGLQDTPRSPSGTALATCRL